MKIALIANPYSGGQKGKKVIPEVERALQEMDCEPSATLY